MSLHDKSLIQFFNPRKLPLYAYPLFLTVVAANVGALWFGLYTAGKPENEWKRDKIKRSIYSNLEIRPDQTTKLYNPNPRKRFRERVNRLFPKRLDS